MLHGLFIKDFLQHRQICEVAHRPQPLSFSHFLPGRIFALIMILHLLRHRILAGFESVQTGQGACFYPLHQQADNSRKGAVLVFRLIISSILPGQIGENSGAKSPALPGRLGRRRGVGDL